MPTKSKEDITLKKESQRLVEVHRTWHKFSNWIIKTYGKDLHGEWQFLEGTGANGKKFKIKHRFFDELKLSQRMVGHEVIGKVENYVKKYCPEIRVIRCDDHAYAGSSLLLIPHPKHGITVFFIPQCTSVQNQFFLYKGHYNALMKALKEMKTVYKNSL
jgi:hypothetical protein